MAVARNLKSLIVVLAVLGMAVVLPPSRAIAQAPGAGNKRGKSASSAESRPVFTAEREAAALVFVERHHPELGSLLERLKPMNEAEYEKAVVELFSLSETLAELSQRDPKRHELAIEAWKARSRVQLLTAQMAGEPSRRAERERALRVALADQLDVELRQQELDRENAQARLRKVEDNISRISRERDSLIEARFRALSNKSKNARQAQARLEAEGSGTKQGEPRKTETNTEKTESRRPGSRATPGQGESFR